MELPFTYLRVRSVTTSVNLPMTSNKNTSIGRKWPEGNESLLEETGPGQGRVGRGKKKGRRGNGITAQIYVQIKRNKKGGMDGDLYLPVPGRGLYTACSDITMLPPFHR